MQGGTKWLIVKFHIIKVWVIIIKKRDTYNFSQRKKELKKVLLPEQSGEEPFALRFLHHPNIAVD